MTNKNSQLICVQASAGSGKTYSLANRYIKLLFDEDHANTIIAVTFTNKAAIEMKYRVMDYLKKGALGLETQGFFNDMSDFQNKSLKAITSILEDYDSFNVKTIDSFKKYILQACAFNLDISPNFQIEKKYTQYLSFAIDAFIKSANKSAPFKKILLDYLDQYIISLKGGWFAKVDIKKQMNEIYTKASNTGKDIDIYEVDFAKEFSKKALQTYEAFLKVSKRITDLAMLIHKNATNAFEKMKDQKVNYFYDFGSISKLLLNYEMPYVAQSKRDDKTEDLWTDALENLKDLFDFYVHNYFAVYTMLYSKVLKELNDRSKKDELVFLNDLNKKALELFRNDCAMLPEIYCRLAEKYQHFLIDECQDTNLVQWAGTQGFLEESLSKGGSLFYVGDVKQSIYRFRGGDPRIFTTIEEEFSNYNCDKKVLQENYRSHKAIVEFNNQVFSKNNLNRFLNDVNEKNKISFDYSEILSVYKDSNQNVNPKKTKGYVEIEILTKAVDDINAQRKEKFLSFVLDINKRFALNDIAVLCRKGKEAIEVISWLMEKGIAAESVQTLNIKNNSFVKQILSIISFISSPIDDLSFASFITGDIFLKKTGLNQKTIEKFLFDNWKARRVKNDGFLYRDFRKHFKEIWENYFEEFFVKAGFIAVYELVILILEKFAVIENFPQSKIFILRFLEVIKEFEKENATIKDFLQHFDELEDRDQELSIRVSSGSGIKVTTMHTAKGLQFPVVIIPFLTLAIEKMEDPYFDESCKDIKLLAVSKEKLGSLCPIAADARQSEKVKSMLDELNVCYVAMTRAECEMYVIVEPSKTNKKSNIEILFDTATVPLITGTKQKYDIAKKDDAALNLVDSFDKGYKDIRQTYITDKNTHTLTSDILKIRKKGTMIHFALSQIVSLKNSNLDEKIENALSKTAKKFLFEDKASLKDDLENLLKAKQISDIFNFDENKILNEKEIVDKNGQTLRIDKLINAGSEILVYDFKSSNADTVANKEQVGKYINAMSEIYPDKSIKGFLIDMKDKKIIEV